MEKSLDISEVTSGTGVLRELSSLNDILCEIRNAFSSSFRDHAESVDSGFQERVQAYMPSCSNCREKPPQYSLRRREREC